MTDGNGALVEHYEYSAYGRERANGTAAPDASHRFTGQIFDAEVGLYYYGARYYDADLGRFIQADTMIPYLFDPQSWNRYAYTLNNPLRFIDPTGHGPLDFIPSLGPGIGQTQGTEALDQMVKDWSERTGRDYGSYHEYMTTRNGATGTATAGDMGKISGIGQITAGAADLYLNGAMGLGESGIAAGVGAGIRSAAERKGATAGAEKGLEKAIPEAGSVASKLEKPAAAELRRPYIRKKVRADVEAAAPKTGEGKFVDPNTKQPIEGKYDLGHKPGNEHWREKAQAEADGLTQKQFNDRMNNPGKLQIEAPSSNRSHKFEKP